MSVLYNVAIPMIAGTYYYGKIFQEIFDADAKLRYIEEGGFNRERQWYLEDLCYSAYKEDTDIFDEAFGRPFYRGNDIDDPFRHKQKAMFFIANKEGWEYYAPGEGNIVYKPNEYVGSKSSYVAKRITAKCRLEEEALEELGRYQKWYDNCPCSYRFPKIFPEQYDDEESYRRGVFCRAVVGVTKDALIEASIKREAEIFGVPIVHPDYYSAGCLDDEGFLLAFERKRGWYVQYKNFDKYVYKEQVDAVDQVYAAWDKISHQETETEFEKIELMCGEINWEMDDEQIIKLQLEVLEDIIERNLDTCYDTKNVIALYVSEDVIKHL